MKRRLKIKYILGFAYLCMVVAILAACDSASPKSIYSKDLPAVKINNGLVQIDRRLEVFKDTSRKDFPYRARVVMSIKSVTPSEVDDVFLVAAFPVFFAPNNKELIFDISPKRLLEKKPAALFHFDTLETSKRLTIDTQADSLPFLALRYDPDGKWRGLKVSAPPELALTSESVQSLANKTRGYALDHALTVKEVAAARQYYREHYPTLNQVKSAADELYLMCAIYYIPMVKVSTDTLDKSTTVRLEDYQSPEVFVDKPRERAARLNEIIPKEIKSVIQMTPVEMLRAFSAAAAEIVEARDRLEKKRPDEKSKTKATPSTPQPASIMTAKGDTNGDGAQELLTVFKLPDNTYQIKIVDIDNNVLFLSDPFSTAPSSVEIKTDSPAKFPIYVIVFQADSGEGAFLGYQDGVYKYLTTESY